jgi:alkylation response protein AidB-like acyl-CoA dehydrogenase
MTLQRPTRQTPQHRTGALLAALATQVPERQRRALIHDREASCPAADLEQLRDIGALAAPVPCALGGLGMGTEPEGADALFTALRLIGRGSLSVGRMVEAHVNALRLIVRFGTAAQAETAARDALAGELFGLWVTDAPGDPLRLSSAGLLSGAKAPCSAGGHATRALVTAELPDGSERMMVIAPPPGQGTTATGWELHGMRASASVRMTLDGIAVDRDNLIGGAGDYLREPDFSAGAWRTSAVTLGGLEALVAETRGQLVARERETDPHQQARIGEALIAQETARLWIARAARIGEADIDDAGDIANYVNLARLAAESACLDAIRIVQRTLGMAAFRRGGLIELLLRDLATYLRQPAPDMVLTEAAAHFMQRDLP